MNCQRCRGFYGPAHFQVQSNFDGHYSALLVCAHCAWASVALPGFTLRELPIEEEIYFNKLEEKD